MALVTVLQLAENLTDRQAADAVRGRIDWKYALGLDLTDPGFDHTVLTGFRQRLIDHGLEEKILDLLLARLGERGLVRLEGGSALIPLMCSRRCHYLRRRMVRVRHTPWSVASWKTDEWIL